MTEAIYPVENPGGKGYIATVFTGVKNLKTYCLK